MIVCIEHGGTASDERKELINSLSGSLEVNLDDNLQGIVAMRHWGRGWGVLSGAPACALCMCIAPHPWEVYSSRVWRFTQSFGSVGNFIRKKSKSLQMICLARNSVCISSTTRSVIECVVDLAELCLNGCDLTGNQWIIILPEGKLKEWQSVSGELWMLYTVHCIVHSGGAHQTSEPVCECGHQIMSFDSYQ